MNAQPNERNDSTRKTHARGALGAATIISAAGAVLAISAAAHAWPGWPGDLVTTASPGAATYAAPLTKNAAPDSATPWTTGYLPGGTSGGGAAHTPAITGPTSPVDVRPTSGRPGFIEPPNPNPTPRPQPGFVLPKSADSGKPTGGAIQPPRPNPSPRPQPGFVAPVKADNVTKQPPTMISPPNPIPPRPGPDVLPPNWRPNPDRLPPTFIPHPNPSGPGDETGGPAVSPVLLPAPPGDNNRPLTLNPGMTDYVGSGDFLPKPTSELVGVAKDKTAGASHLRAVPAPGTAALAALAGLTAARRRRG